MKVSVLFRAGHQRQVLAGETVTEVGSMWNVPTQAKLPVAPLTVTLVVLVAGERRDRKS